MNSYPTEGAKIFVETGKSASQIVFDEADAPVWLRSYTTFFQNTNPGWRPSDACREIVRQWKAGHLTEDRVNAEYKAMRESQKAQEKGWGWLG